MSSPVLVVTGANRGVGLGIVNLISALPTTYTVFLTSRSGRDLPYPPSSSQSTYIHRALDITDIDSVQRLASEVKTQYPNGIEALVNNAGVNLNPQGYSVETIEQTMRTNFYGTQSMCDAFIPLIQDGGRIVNVASVGGHLNGYSKVVRERFENATKSSLALMNLVDEYESLVSQNKEQDHGFKPDAYCVSKAFVVALTKSLAMNHAGLQINCCCPGWVDTDMGSQLGKPPKSLEDGGKIPLRLAIGDIGVSTGDFWENNGISSTADGKINRKVGVDNRGSPFSTHERYPSVDWRLQASD